MAQTSASVEGVVVDRSGIGVQGATLTFFTRQAVRYQATTDAKGIFHLARMDPGSYEVMIEKTGFVVFPKELLGVSGGAVRLQYVMQFGSARTASLTGRVFNPQDQPASGVQVDLIVSPELWHRTSTDAQGRFHFDQVTPGAYLLRASPPNGATNEVPTYFPGAIDEAEAQRIVVRGKAEVNGLQLRTAPVFHVKGIVSGENGPVSQVTVKLVPVTQQPAHVVANFANYFITMDAAPATGPDQAHTTTGGDGSFEFVAAGAGEYRVVAEAAPAFDTQTGFNLTRSGSSSLRIIDTDAANLRINLSEPFTWSIATGGWPVAQCHDPAQAARAIAPLNEKPVVLCPVDSLPDPIGNVYPIWFQSVDGQASFLSASVNAANGATPLPLLHPGRYFVRPLPLLPSLALTNGRGLSYSRPSIRNQGLNKSEPFDLDRNSGGLQLNGGGVFNPDGTKPVQPALLAGPGEVRGMVQDGAGAAVVLVPEQNLEGGMGEFVQCQSDGSFTAPNLAPGSYFIAALRGLDIEGLRAPEALARVLSRSVKVRVAPGESTSIQTVAEAWAD